MWHYFPRGPLENRVLKTRFIIEKNFKNLPSPKHGLTSPDRIRTERDLDQREGDQIREREIVRSERERKKSRGSRTWVARTQVGFFFVFSVGFFCVFFFFFPRLCFLGRCWLGIYWVRNRVLETRFPCRRHLEKVSRKRRTTHENWALKTRFRSPKSSL